MPREASELELTRACARRDAAALVDLDALIVAETRRAVAPLRGSSADDVCQLVRERLLTGPQPRIAEFRGDGPLRSWLRAVAVRVALNARRGDRLEEPRSDVSDLPGSAADPELRLFRAQYREQFRAAFSTAVAALSPRDRAVLRLHALDGVTLAGIGKIYGKDASTVSRWLDQIRGALNEKTRTALTGRLGLSSAELESLFKAAERDVSVSLSRLLAD